MAFIYVDAIFLLSNIVQLTSLTFKTHPSQVPKKGFLTALKSLCSGTASIATLVTALIKLFFPS